MAASELYGDGGDDQLIGGIGYNELYGGTGCDELRGGESNDHMHDDNGPCDNRDEGQNYLAGYGGDDEIILDLTTDGGGVVATGGEGNNVFHVNSYTAGDNSQAKVNGGPDNDEVNFWLLEEPVKNPDFSPGTGRDSLRLFLPQRGGNNVLLSSESDELTLKLNEHSHLLPAFEVSWFTANWNSSWRGLGG